MLPTQQGLQESEKFIEKCLKEFHDSLAKLKHYDKTFLLPPGVTAGIALLFGSASLFGVICIAAASEYLRRQHRNQYYKSYQFTLDKLVRVYKWYLENSPQSSRIAQLKKVLSPYVKDSDLQPKLENKPNSSSFFATLTHIPSTAASQIFHFFSGNKNPETKEIKPEAQFDWTKLTAETAVNEIHHQLYGYHKPESTSTSLRRSNS